MDELTRDNCPMAQGLNRILEAFFVAKRHQLRSAASMKHVTYFMTALRKDLISLFPTSTPDQLTIFDLRMLVDHWTQQKRSGGWIRVAVKYVRNFFKWGVEEDLLARNPAARLVYNPNEPYKKYDRVPREDIGKLLGAMDGTSFLDVQARAFTLTMLDTALRVEEVCMLRYDDLDLAAGRILVRKRKRSHNPQPKGFGETARRALVAYLELRQALPQLESEFLFVNSEGQRLKARNLAQRLEIYSDKAGIKKVTPHRLRVTSAVEAYKIDYDVFKVQQLLGHKYLDMTLYYVSVAVAEENAERCASASVSDQLLLPGQGVGGSQANAGPDDMDSMAV